MLRKLLLSSVFGLMLLPVSNVSAQERTPVETFIDQVKETNQFVNIDNIWRSDKTFDKTALLQKVEKAEPLTIDYTLVANLIKQNKTAISLVVPGIGGGFYTIDLAQYSFLTNDFQVHTLGANNKDEAYSYTPGLYYQGVVNGIPGSVAAFSFFNNEVYGIFSIPGEGNYTLVPNTMVGNYFDHNTHYVLYNDDDLKIKEFAPKCSADELPDLSFNPLAKTTTTVNNKVYNNCTEVRVFEVGDYAIYKTKGFNATNVTNFITALFNNQATVYRNEGIPIVLKYVQVNTAKDNYQNITVAQSNRFLDTFGKVTQNTLHGCDVALLVSTALNGGYGALGGIAWLKSMCASYDPSSHFGPYGFANMDNSAVVNFPTYSWNVEVIAHEMGHIIGSPHTHRCCWNPPARVTAIDGCYTIEGSCPNPGVPSTAVKGTIMSYCHLVSSGINLSNGFGPQPGDTIRRFISNIFSSSCGARYNPSAVSSTPNKTISANRECTDLVGGVSTTYYWYDANTADHADDTLVLMIIKNGNNIGNLNNAGFSVSSSTVTGYSSGTGISLSFPAGTPLLSVNNIGMRRFWKITPTSTPTSAVEVIFPFLPTDTSDVNGTVPGVFGPIVNYKMFKVNNPIDPNPANNFSGSVSSNFSIYKYGTTASTSEWSLTTTGITQFAHMKMTNLSGGGSGFYSYKAAGIDNLGLDNSGISIYPNPTNNSWYVSMDNNITGAYYFNLYSVDGKAVSMQQLKAGNTVTIDASSLAPGIYYYRIIGDSNTFTGSLVRE